MMIFYMPLCVGGICCARPLDGPCFFCTHVLVYAYPICLPKSYWHIALISRSQWERA
ncbi:hypothetical protein BS78_01G272400 [Paspalum vaginatum]|nr:hypothetical protein BS78_01G272400 [Paspalum vaginatum]